MQSYACNIEVDLHDFDIIFIVKYWDVIDLEIIADMAWRGKKNKNNL